MKNPLRAKNTSTAQVDSTPYIGAGWGLAIWKACPISTIIAEHPRHAAKYRDCESLIGLYMKQLAAWSTSALESLPVKFIKAGLADRPYNVKINMGYFLV